MAYKSVAWPLKQISRSTHLYRSPTRHYHHLLREGQCLHLVVGDVNQSEFELPVNLFEFAAQLPFQMRINHGQGFIK